MNTCPCALWNVPCLLQSVTIFDHFSFSSEILFLEFCVCINSDEISYHNLGDRYVLQLKLFFLSQNVSQFCSFVSFCSCLAQNTSLQVWSLSSDGVEYALLMVLNHSYSFLDYFTDFSCRYFVYCFRVFCPEKFSP